VFCLDELGVPVQTSDTVDELPYALFKNFWNFSLTETIPAQHIL
jgi:hypothetical protein